MSNSTATSPDIELFSQEIINPFVAFTTQLLSVGVIPVAASYSLKRWIAVSSLSPPVPSDDQTKAAEAQAPEVVRKGWRRVFNKDAAKATLALSLYAGLQYFVFFVLPSIKSRKVINGIWGTLIFICFSAAFDGVGRIFFDSQVYLQPMGAGKGRGFVLKQGFNRHKAWGFLGVGLSLASIIAFYAGLNFLLPLVAAAWTVTSLAHWMTPKLNLRYVVMLLNGYIICVPLVAVLIGVIVEFFSSGESKPKDPSDKPVMPSLWLFQLMLAFPNAMPAMIPGIMLALSYRFDHRQSSSGEARAAAGPGEAVALPTTVAPFNKPTFAAGMSALGLSILAAQIFNAVTHSMPQGIESIYIFFTIPIVTLAMAGSAWSRGQLRDWWMYSETWVPKADELKAPAKEDTEAVAGAETDNENEKLLQPSDGA